MRKALRIAAITIGVLIIGGAAVLAFASYRASHYWDYVEADGSIEATYIPLGPIDVSHVEMNSDAPAASVQEIWYPTPLDDTDDEATYPLVVFANGTGTPATDSEPILRHLASWGFIVVGNQDENSRSGQSSSDSLDFMLTQNDNPDSDFYQHIDADHIGIAGHSQGGVGAINAATQFPNSNRYDAIFLASPTSPAFAQDDALGTDWSFDATAITAPTFAVAGTGQFDAGTATSPTDTEGQGITPLWALQQLYNNIPADVDKLVARRVDTDHADTVRNSDGYMTAWFAYWLQDDEGAAAAFLGSEPEIETNANWQDVQLSQ